MISSLLVEGGTVVTCDGDDRVVTGDVAVHRGAIVGIGPRARDALVPPYRVIDARGCAVVPGFVQAHVHLVQALFRGMADDLPLLDWLRRFIWPLEAAHDERSLTASAELGLAEMIRAGTTCILDMGTTHGHDAIFAVCERSGIRAVSGKAMMDLGEGVPKRLRESTRASLRESERLARAWTGRGDGRLGYAFAPRFILSCSEPLFRGAVALSHELSSLVHTHAAEHPVEREAVKNLLGDEDIAILARWGVTGPRAILAHGVQLTDAEIAGLARAGTRLVHCPSANLKLGSGIARIHDARRAGVVVGLGADGAPCNNNLDPFVEMRHAALLSKTRSGTTTLPAREVLRMATIDGARALGLDAITGSLEIGKRADLAVISLVGEHVAPATDVASSLVYACQSRDVRHVVIDGAHVVAHGELSTIDAPRSAQIAREEARRVATVARILQPNSTKWFLLRKIGSLVITVMTSKLRVTPGLLAVLSACAIAVLPYGCSGSPSTDAIPGETGAGGDSAGGTDGGTGGNAGGTTGKGGSAAAGKAGASAAGGTSTGKGGAAGSGTAGAGNGATGAGAGTGASAGSTGTGAGGTQTFGQGGTTSATGGSGAATGTGGSQTFGQGGAGGDPFGGPGQQGMGGNTAGGMTGAGGMTIGGVGGSSTTGPMGPGAGGMTTGPGAGGMTTGPGVGGSSTTTGMGGSTGTAGTSGGQLPGPCSDGTCSGATQCCKGLGNPCGTNVMFMCL